MKAKLCDPEQGGLRSVISALLRSLQDQGRQTCAWGHTLLASFRFPGLTSSLHTLVSPGSTCSMAHLHLKPYCLVYFWGSSPKSSSKLS